MTSCDHLAVRAPAPDWFNRAIGEPAHSRFVTVEDCPIHYLLWPGPDGPAERRGLLFVHGGGAHARWWSFIAPYFAGRHRVAAMDLSGMGDSGRRTAYDSDMRAAEMRAVIADAELGSRPIVVGHSFGGYMSMRFASLYGETIEGMVIVDSPVRSPEEEAKRPHRRPRMGSKRIYPDFETALSRFRLMPEQACANEFLVEFIARHSLMQADGGWTWKFDGAAMKGRRFDEPFRDYLAAARCRRALIYGETSALLSRGTAAYMSSLMGPGAPIVEIPQAQHHVTLDQPLAFVAALRALLEGWARPS